jgi:hypothetical protein
MDMSNAHCLVAQRVHEHGAAHVARVLGISRAAVVSYIAGAARMATTVVIEQRASRLEDGGAGGAPAQDGAA